MSAASSASRPPMKMPVRATPFGPREKMASCVSAADRVDADIGVRHDDLVAGVGRHVDVERAHLMARREHVEDVGTFHGVVSVRSIPGAVSVGQRTRRDRATCPRSRPRDCAPHDAQRERGRRSSPAARAAATSASARACEATMAKPVGPHELWPIAAVGPCGRADPAPSSGRPRAGVGTSALRPARSARRAAAGCARRRRRRLEVGAARARQHAHQHLVADFGRGAAGIGGKRGQARSLSASPARPARACPARPGCARPRAARCATATARLRRRRPGPPSTSRPP